MSAKKSRTKSKAPAQPALDTILGELSDAMTFVEVVVRALQADDGRGGPELHVLEHGLVALRATYTKLDLAISHQE